MHDNFTHMTAAAGDNPHTLTHHSRGLREGQQHKMTSEGSSDYYLISPGNV